jgi:hypothetical protein
MPDAHKSYVGREEERRREKKKKREEEVSMVGGARHSASMAYRTNIWTY